MGVVQLMTPALDPLGPAEGVRMYLKHRESDIEARTFEAYATTLNYFITFCEQEGIPNLYLLTGRTLEKYRLWRREDSSEVTPGLNTMRDEMYLFRDFIRCLESIEAVANELREKENTPKLAFDESDRDIKLQPERTQRILGYLETDKYASVEHVVWILLCDTARRLGAIHSINVSDFRANEGNPYLTLPHSYGMTDVAG